MDTIAIGQKFAALSRVANGASRSGAPVWLRELPAVEVLRVVLLQNYVVTTDATGREVIRAREGRHGGLPPGRARLSSPYDTDARGAARKGGPYRDPGRVSPPRVVAGCTGVGALVGLRDVDLVTVPVQVITLGRPTRQLTQPGRGARVVDGAQQHQRVGVVGRHQLGALGPRARQPPGADPGAVAAAPPSVLRLKFVI